MHLNVTDVWKLGVTGRNVTVAVVDDGLEWDNPDIKPNYNPLGSIDLNDNDNDPMPNEKNGNSPNNGRQILSCMKSVILRPVPVQSAFCIILRVPVFIALKFEGSLIEWAQDGKHVCSPSGNYLHIY